MMKFELQGWIVLGLLALAGLARAGDGDVVAIWTEEDSWPTASDVLIDDVLTSSAYPFMDTDYRDDLTTAALEGVVRDGDTLTSGLFGPAPTAGNQYVTKDYADGLSGADGITTDSADGRYLLLDGANSGDAGEMDWTQTHTWTVDQSPGPGTQTAVMSGAGLALSASPLSANISADGTPMIVLRGGTELLPRTTTITHDRVWVGRDEDADDWVGSVQAGSAYFEDQLQMGPSVVGGGGWARFFSDGTLWVDEAFDPSQIADADGDTYVRTEASEDEDVIRFGAGAGGERMTIRAAGTSMAEPVVIGGVLQLGDAGLQGAGDVNLVVGESSSINILGGGQVGTGGFLRLAPTSARIEFDAPAAGAWDVNLYRGGANTLKTDDAFQAASYAVGTTAVIDASRVGTFTQTNTDNVRIDGNTISTTNTNGDLNLAPNGTGAVQISTGKLFLPGMPVDYGADVYWESGTGQLVRSGAECPIVIVNGRVVGEIIVTTNAINEVAGVLPLGELAGAVEIKIANAIDQGGDYLNHVELLRERPGAGGSLTLEPVSMRLPRELRRRDDRYIRLGIGEEIAFAARLSPGRYWLRAYGFYQHREDAMSRARLDELQAKYDAAFGHD